MMLTNILKEQLAVLNRKGINMHQQQQGSSQLNKSNNNNFPSQVINH